MNEKGSFKIKLIFILVIVLLVPILIISFIFINRNTSYVRETVNKKNMNLAKGLQDKVTITIENVQSVMEILSKRNIIQNMTPNEQVDDLLTGVVKDYPTITQIYIMRKDGMQIYKTSGQLGDRSDRDYFQKAVRGDLNYSDVIISRSQGFPVIVLALPIKQAEEIKGVIGASLNLSFLSQLVNEVKPGENGYGYIVERNGKVIAHPNDKYVDKRKDLSYLPPVKKVIKGKQGTSEYIFEETKKLVSFQPINKTDWGVLVQISSKEAFSKIKQEKMFFALMVGITILVAIGLAFRVTKPIIRLSQSMDSFAIGDKIDLQNENTGIQEVEQIKKSYLNMAEEINNNYEQLEAYSEEVTAMNEELSEAIEKTKELNNRFKEMASLISNLVTGAHKDKKEFLSDLLNTAVKILPKADYGNVYIYEEGKVSFVDCIGYDLDALQQLTISADSFYNQEHDIEVATVKELRELNKEAMDEKVFTAFKQALKPIKEIITCDLIVNGDKKVGISVDIAANSEQSFSENSIKLFDAFHNLAAAFFKLKEYNKLQDQFTKELITSMINILEEYDKYTSGHSENVAELSAEIAAEMDLAQPKINDAYWAGMVHDIGKLLVPLEILNKEETLTKDEYEIIKNHPLWGYEALHKSESLRHIAEYVLYHHERWEGSGYPDGLKGKEIPLISQILAVADAWDAMTSKRAYRDPLSEPKALQEIRKNKGMQFAPKVVNAFLRKRGGVMKDNKNRDYFKSIISAVPDLIILFDEEGNYLDVWTSKTEDLVAPKNELIDKNVDEFLPEEVANNFKKYCSLAIDNDELQAYEYSLDFKEGKKYFENYLVPVDVEDENSNEVLAVIRNITERKIAELELERASNRLELTVKGVKLGLWDWNIRTNRIETSKQCSKLLGYEPPNSFAHWKELIHEADKAKISQLMDKFLNGDISYRKIEYRIKTEENNYKWIQTIGKVVKWDKNGNPVRVLGILKDIDKRKQVEEELKRQKAYSQQLFNKSPNAIVLLDNEDRVIKVNKSFEQLFEYKQTNIKGEKINNLIIPEKNLDEAIEKSLKVKHGEQVSDEVVRETKNGKKIYVEINVFPIKLDQGQIGIYGIYRNISKRKKEEARIKYLSFHDEMTELYNRRYFENEIEKLNNSRKLPISIIIGDMDGLKYINDNYGHKMGDEFIKKAAEVFKAATRQEDIVARIGGDEFAIMLPEADFNTAKKICERIQAKTKWHSKKIDLSEPLKISLGYAVKIDQTQNLDEIFNKADQKMYQNKEVRKCSLRDD